MKSLFINTSTKKLIISIVVDQEIKYLYKGDNSNNLSVDLMSIIDEAFRSVSMEPSDLDTIFVTNGPGTFTGIRIGLTVIKIMAWSLNIKVVPISSLEFMASIKAQGRYIVPLIDARKGYVFAGVYDENLNSVIPDSYVFLDDLVKRLDDKEIYYVSHDEFDFVVHESDYDILKIIDKHRNDVGVNPHKLNPNYLKNTEVEEKIRESSR